MWKKKFIEAIRLVSVSYNEQIEKFPQNFPVADEIALNFNDEIFEQIDYLLEIDVINQIQYQELQKMHTLFSRMSSNKEKDFWSMEALEKSKEWSECRYLALKVLEADDSI